MDVPAKAAKTWLPDPSLQPETSDDDTIEDSAAQDPSSSGESVKIYRQTARKIVSREKWMKKKAYKREADRWNALRVRQDAANVKLQVRTALHA